MLLRIDRLTKEYRRGVRANDEICLEVAAGQAPSTSAVRTPWPTRRWPGGSVRCNRSPKRRSRA